MSSVAKCLVLAGVALEADALLLQTGTQHELCKEHGCSGDSKAAGGNDICKAFEDTKAITEATKKKEAKVESGTADTEDGKMKINEKEYSCKKATCSRDDADGKKKDQETTIADVQKNLGDNPKQLADVCEAAKKKKGDSTEEDKNKNKADAKDLCDAIADLKKAGKKSIKAVAKNDGSDPKSVSVTIGTAEPVSYKCAGTKKCNKADGTATGTMADVKAEDVDKAATGNYADGVETFDAMCKK